SAARSAASALRRAARCTTLLTVTAPVTNSSNASMFCGASMVQVCTGGVKYQFSSSPAATAANTAGQNPPTKVTTITAIRYSNTSSTRASWARAAADTAVSAGKITAASATPAN